MQIEDGSGKGYSSKVNEEGQLFTDAMVRTFFQHRTADGYSFAVNIAVTPVGPGDCFFYLKNTYSQNIFINGIKIVIPSTGDRIQVVTSDIGTPVDGSDIVPVNFNTASGIKANVICQQGTNITGLNGGNMIDDISLPSTSLTQRYIWEPSIIIAPGTTFTLYAVTGTVPIRCHVPFIFDGDEYH